MAEQFDLIVIGAGSGARYGAQKAARDYGAKVALIERTRWGGSCPNVACKPTKAYLVVADLLHDINTIAERLGPRSRARRRSSTRTPCGSATRSCRRIAS